MLEYLASTIVEDYIKKELFNHYPEFKDILNDIKNSFYEKLNNGETSLILDNNIFNYFYKEKVKNNFGYDNFEIKSFK